jgi:hypothetical protein
MKRTRHTGKLENLGGQVLHDGSDVNGSFGSDSNIVCVLVPQESGCQCGLRGMYVSNQPVDTSNRELGCQHGTDVCR